MSSNVCRFFLNNNCRFGNRCRFSHDLRELERGNKGNPYVYVNEHQPPKESWSQNVSNSSGVQQVVQSMAVEAKQVEYDKMWPLTCVSVLKDASNVPGWEDFSMEELRSAAYSAKSAGRFDDYVKFYESVLRKARDNRAIFLRPGRAAEDLVRQMLSKQREQFSGASSTVSTPPAFNTAHIPAFGGAPFASATASSPFAAASPPPETAGMFARAAQGFSSSSAAASSPFSQPRPALNDTEMDTAGEVGGQQQPTAISYHQNIFGQVPQKPLEGSAVFGSTSFSQPSQPGSAPQQGSVFTLMADLTPTELQQFQATTFTLDKLPLRPPPRELC